MRPTRTLWWKRLARGGATLAVALGVVGLAGGVQAAGDPNVVGLTTTNGLVQFNDARPDRILARATISGLASGETMLGIDVRPATGQLFGVSSASQLYTIDPASGAATKVGTPFVLPLNFDSAVGIDFNPTVDRLRVVTDKGQNLRVNPITGAVVDADPNTAGVQPDGSLAYGSNDRNRNATPNVVAVAYTNNFAGATLTTLYDIDSELDALSIQNLPNAGTLNTVGELRVNATDLVGFDIFSDEDGDNARAAIQKAGEPSKYYTVDLDSGRAKMKDKGTIGGGAGLQVRDIAVLP